MLDFSQIGLKVGIEIHRQLNTKSKLFCNCPTRLFTGEPTFTFLRRLRPTQSELGKFDPAALFEFQKGRVIIYEIDSETSCLVEVDEEPPHDLNGEAVDIALQVSYLLNSKPVDEIHVMRKIVIDGSNTCGFQRTCIIALGGSLKLGGKEIFIQTISLEEDAARKIEEKELEIKYRLDRLGIPLIELATAPVISTPEEAEKAALALGNILKRTGRVKRGIGTIRQDLNVSIEGGALAEIKGVQELNIISKVVEYEAQRQLTLIRIRDEMRNRNIAQESFRENFIDVTDFFRETGSSVLKKALTAGGVILAASVKGMAGLFKIELEPKLRFGSELSDRARFYGGVGGIFHTDELPGYGITQHEVDLLREKLNLANTDGAVIVADGREKAERALKAVIDRLREALDGVPEETRVSKPDGTTRYMRPRPGAARLYPETDVPPIPVPLDWRDKVERSLPPPRESVIDELVQKYGINKKLSEQLYDSEYLPIFKRSVLETKSTPTFIASALTETLKGLERKGIQIDSIDDEQLFETFNLIGKGRTAKESFPNIVEKMAKTGANPAQIVEELGLTVLTLDKLESIIEKYIIANEELIKQAPPDAFNRLMKIVMGQVRGRADAKDVAEILKNKLAR